MNSAVEEDVAGRNTLLPGLKTGADEVKVVGVVAPDSMLALTRRSSFSHEVMPAKKHSLSSLDCLLFRLRRILVLFSDTVSIHAALVLKSTRPVNQDVSTQSLRAIYVSPEPRSDSPVGSTPMSQLTVLQTSRRCLLRTESRVAGRRSLDRDRVSELGRCG